MRYRYAAILACTAIAAACPGTTEPVPLIGPWGGNHIALVVTDSGGTLEYDCASGTMDGPIQLDARGHFRISGTHIAGQGGPAREGEIPDPRPALYQGEIKGSTLRLEVQVAGQQQSLGPFVLRKDAAPRLLTCL